MKKIHINVSSPYDVIIERGSINNCGQLISQVLSTKKQQLLLMILLIHFTATQF